MGILCDVLVNIAFFIFLDDFIILDYKVDFEVSIILEKSFPDTGRELVSIKIQQMKF